MEQIFLRRQSLSVSGRHQYRGWRAQRVASNRTRTGGRRGGVRLCGVLLQKRGVPTGYLETQSLKRTRGILRDLLACGWAFPRCDGRTGLGGANSVTTTTKLIFNF